MNKDLLDDICEIEAEFARISNLVQVLKDAVENNDDSYYLLTYVVFLQQSKNNFADSLDKYNQKIGKKLCKA